MANDQISIPPRKLVSAILENLNIQFFADTRSDAKLLYQAIINNEQVPFMHMAVRSGGEVHCNLTLDCSCYLGKLNFGKFRQSLATMMLAMSNLLDTDQEPNILSSEKGDMLFNIPGVFETDGNTNVLICGLAQTAPGRADISLMFLDPSQYQTTPTEST